MITKEYKWFQKVLELTLDGRSGHLPGRLWVFYTFVFSTSLWSSCGIYARSQLICSESTLVDVIHNSLGYAADDINRHLWWVPSREFCDWRDWNRLLISLNIRRFVHSHSGSICLFYIWSVHSFCVICCLQKQKGELFQRHLNKRVRNHFKAKFNLKCVRSAHLQKRPRQTFVKKKFYKLLRKFPNAVLAWENKQNQ